VYYEKAGQNEFNILATINSNVNKEVTVTYTGGTYDEDYFDPLFYDTDNEEEDFQVFNINKYGRWMRFRISSNDNIIIKGWKLTGRLISNKEL
jgi:hypothetical protein